MASFPVKIDHNKIMERFEKDLKGGRGSRDTRFWTITKKNDIGRAVIRFLPNKDLDSTPFVTKYIHKYNFKNKDGTEKYFTAPSLENAGRPDPVIEWCRRQDKQWIDKHGLFPRKRFVSNIMVIDDEEKNNIGKVFLFEYGSQVMEILQNKLKPKIKQRAPLFYYDFDKGANLEIILAKDANGFMGWKDSQFMEQCSIMEFLESENLDPQKVLDSMYDLKEVIASTEYPSYEQMKTDFENWLEASGILNTMSTVPADSPRVDRGAAESGVSLSQATRQEAEKETVTETKPEPPRKTFSETIAEKTETEKQSEQSPKQETGSAVAGRMRKLLKKED